MAVTPATTASTATTTTGMLRLRQRLISTTTAGASWLLVADCSSHNCNCRHFCQECYCSCCCWFRCHRNIRSDVNSGSNAADFDGSEDDEDDDDDDHGVEDDDYDSSFDGEDRLRSCDEPLCSHEHISSIAAFGALSL